MELSTERDLRVHNFEGHSTQRPIMVLRGRECGNSRLTITGATSVEDWVIHSADAVALNGSPASADDVAKSLATKRSGIAEVSLRNSDVVQTFHFEFSLAEEDDLDGVDDALNHFIKSGELSLRAIDDFIMRSKRYSTASRYLSGVANYLYGVLAREDSADSAVCDEARDRGSYQGKYDKAVAILRGFDRPPAEAVCGIVAFHYNQFGHAMTKTKSQRVAEVSLRFQALLKGEAWSRDDLSRSPHSSLDFALSDSVIEQVLRWSALPLNGSALAEVEELTASIDSQRPYDVLKLHLIAAEHALSAGDLISATRHAERLRDSSVAEIWYAAFRNRAHNQGVS
ncbi:MULTISPECIES: hypothetical protein [unclassified Arthrobacter]|uniref:hypothetical protein n=1 Tax=unclassified Arthrobacter TaxID=235627 RepID=UPI002101DCC2|nr:MULTISPECIES: hypothetical protein [unclassified Arthrobacter]MCQ1947237.1 hypothetical protein [Arthrobacter sp. zg-Y1116]MCQ1995276.1 hypothetical protein [Arthrobacter sp. zg-Y1171]UWX80685.1 hypothetical protein N2L00_09560 [Arthrobacter sp. zg-Y1171]